MAQTFRYPNLLDVSAGHAVLAAGRIGDIPSVVCHGDPVVGDYYRVIPEQDLTSWSFVNITDVSAAGDVPVGTRMAISLLMRVGGEPYHAYPNLLLGQGIDGLLGSIAYSHEDVGGGGRCALPPGCAQAWRTRDRFSMPLRRRSSRRPEQPSTLLSPWSASPTSLTHGRQRQGRCGRR